jgi:uncharacterized delta-60 repeat protein
MASSDAGVLRADPWSAFFATPWPWLAHAAIWASGMLAVNSVLSLIHLAGPVSALAAVGATVTAYLLSPAQREVDLAAAVRFALVDSIFLGLAAGLFFPLLLLALRFAGWSRGADPIPIALSVTVAAFVVQFYVLLWGATTLRRRRGPWQRAPLAVACLAGVGLAWSVWHQTAEHLAFRQEVAHKLSAYERETGKRADPVRAEIELSLHGFYGRPEDLVVDRQGRLAVVGEFSFYAGHEVRGLARINPDGSLDETFQYATPDAGVPAGPARVRLLRDGAMLIDVQQAASALSSPSPLMLRTLRPDGVLEERPAVNVGTWSPNPYERRLAPFDVQADGRILVGRYSMVEQGAQPACVRRFLADGTADLAFETAEADALDSSSAQPAHNCAVTDVLALPDGKIVVRLSRRDSEGVWREEMLRRLHADGRVDEGFLPGLTGIRHLVAGQNGALIATTLASTSTPPVFSLWKLRDDGTPDPAFAIAPGFFAHVDALAIQSDGKVLVGGRRSGSALDLGLFRLLPDGRLDSSFGENGRVAVNGFIHRIVTSPGGQIYLLGDFMDVGARTDRVARYQIARLHSDGTLDPTFDPR